MKKIITLLFGLIGFFSVQAQPAKNMTLAGQLTYNKHISDIWAFVDSTGHEYALVGLYDGVSIVDISTDPGDPQELYFIPGEGTTWRDLKTWQKHAYVTNEGGDGLLIIDLSQLPTSISYKDTVLENIVTAHNLWIDEFGIMYMVGVENVRRTLGGGMYMFDLKQDPEDPVYLGNYSFTYVHDVYVRDNKAYAAESDVGFLTILDVKDHANPTVLGRRTYANPLTHNTWLNDAGNICFTTDELDEAFIYAWDVSDPTDITEMDRIRSSLSDGKATPHNVHVHNDFLVTSYYHDGINIIDAHRPSNMIEVGYFDTNDLSDGGLFGCWGAYPFLPSGHILATDQEEGLFIFRSSYPRACYLEGKVIDAQSRQNLVNVSIQTTNPPLNTSTNNLGEYASGTPDSGSYEVTFYKHGYWPQSRNITMSPGQVSNAFIALNPAPLQDISIEIVDKESQQIIPNAYVTITTLDQVISDTYQADALGTVTDSAIFSGLYTITAGKWGYVTQSGNYSVDSLNKVITIELYQGYYDDFLYDYNWRVDGDATTGDWERVEPIGTGGGPFRLNPFGDIPDDFGTFAFVTDNSSSFIHPGDVDSGKTVLMSPLMDLSTYDDPVLHYHYWFSNIDWWGTRLGDDSMRVIVEQAGRQEVVAVYKADSVFGWKKQEPIFLKNYFSSLGRQVAVKFEVGDYLLNDITEAGIDEFMITDGPNRVSIDEEVTSLIAFTLFPNPVKDALHIRYDLTESVPPAKLTFELFHINGQHITSIPFNPWEEELVLSFPYPAGLYIGSLVLDGRKVGVRKLVKR